MNRTLVILMAALCLTAGEMSAQSADKTSACIAFKHLDLGVEIGTMGLGLQLSTPITDFARLRTGFTFMPGFEVPMSFDIGMMSENPSESKSYFNKMSQLVHDNFGMNVKDNVEMIGKPSNFWNWNVIVDIYPLKNNKHWRISGGFYLGPSRIAKTYNRTEDMQSLLAVNIYNTMYGKFVNDKMNYFMDEAKKVNPNAKYPDELMDVSLFDFSALGSRYEGLGINDTELLKVLYDKFRKAGPMGVHVGDYVNDVLYPEDVYIDVDDGEGNITQVLVHHKGDVMYKAGDPYYLKPDEFGMVKADMHVNRFKPYLGVGYEGRLSKKDDRWKIAVDAGVLFWGGSPSVVTHEGVDLVHDVKNVGGKVGSYVEAIDKFKVYPMVSVRFTRTLF